VAGKAVCVLELLFCVSRAGPKEQGQSKRLGEDSLAGVHAIEKILQQEFPQ
jgi:hypothetical protein